MRAVHILAAGLTWAACSVGSPSSGEVDPGKIFSLVRGDSASVSNETLKIGFETVIGDSRCAKGERCVWAGDAIVQVWLQQGSGMKEMREIHTATGSTPAVIALGRELRLLRLDPYPIVGKVIDQRDYVATLLLSSTARSDPDK